MHVDSEGAGRLVTAVAILFEGLHHNPVEIAANFFRQLSLAPAFAGPRRSPVAVSTCPAACWVWAAPLRGSAAGHLVIARLVQPFVGQRRRAGQQLVEQDAETE